ncbi:arrestin domain-containing protein 3-like isoform X1 [Nelusetta ayraudi]|uniref:arrestin domain-containing protein 3-like isoform X1 n=1 Tax=Nelusetta ayraudi TaxID=303726 RepID=UPI003F7196F0
MSSSVKSLSVSYEPAANPSNTFSNGDWVSGQVTLELLKDCQVESLSVKFKGKADVLWTVHTGNTTIVYSSKEKYFSTKHHFIRDPSHKEDHDETLLTNQHGETYSSVVAPGCHVYPFRFQIPFQDMPSSFTGRDGKIVYSLKAVLSRSMRINKKDSTKINFIAKEDLSSDSMLMEPQRESKEKKMKLLNSGKVTMDVNLEKTGFFQGEGLKVVAYIVNNSSREIKPKYTVYRKHSFFANGTRNVHTKDLIKEVGEPIPASTSQNVTKVISIPHDAEPSILNCSIIKAEYRLRVYLDVKYASDPEIKFPIVFLRAHQGSSFAPPPAASDFECPYPPAWGFSPAQPPATGQPMGPPPSYEAHGLYPHLSNFGNTHQ